MHFTYTTQDWMYRTGVAVFVSKTVLLHEFQWHCCPAHFEVLTAMLLTLQSFCPVVLTAMLLTVQSFCPVTPYLWVKGIAVPSVSGVVLVCLAVEGTAIFRNVGNLSPNGTASHDLSPRVWFLLLTACNSSAAEWGSSTDDVWQSGQRAGCDAV